MLRFTVSLFFVRERAPQCHQNQLTQSWVAARCSFIKEQWAKFLVCGPVLIPFSFLAFTITYTPNRQRFMNFLCPLFVKCLFWLVILSHLLETHNRASFSSFAGCLCCELSSPILESADSVWQHRRLSHTVLTTDQMETSRRTWFVILDRHFTGILSHCINVNTKFNVFQTKNRAVRVSRVVLCFSPSSNVNSAVVRKCWRERERGCLNAEHELFFLNLKRFYSFGYQKEKKPDQPLRNPSAISIDVIVKHLIGSGS